MDVEVIRRKGRSKDFVLTRHAARECAKDRINGEDLLQAISSSKVIEEYPEDVRGLSCLVLGHTKNGRPIHVVLGNLDVDVLTVITAYRPDLQPYRWSEDYHRRRKGSNDD
jgi:hypothetical protein